MEWRQVTCCPVCGGKLTLSEYYTYSLDFTITKKGVLSKRCERSESGPIDCVTAYCDDCGAYWDGSQTAIESDNTVWLKVERREENATD